VLAVRPLIVLLKLPVPKLSVVILSTSVGLSVVLQQTPCAVITSLELIILLINAVVSVIEIISDGDAAISTGVSVLLHEINKNATTAK
jgi:hypothetical protein